MSRPPPLIQGLLVVGVWGVCFVVIRAILPLGPPLFFGAIRALLGAAVLVAYLAWQSRVRGREWRSPEASLPLSGIRSGRLLVGLSLLNVTLAFGAMFLAAGVTASALAAIVAGSQPIVLVVGGAMLFGERTTRAAVAGIALAMGGVVVVALSGAADAPAGGIALAVTAALAPAAGTLLMRRLDPGIDIVSITGLQFLLGGALLLGASALVETGRPVYWNWQSIAGLAFLGIVGTGLAYAVWFSLLTRIPLVRIGALLFLVPVVGAGVGVAAGDRLGSIELVSMAAILLGISVVVRGQTADQGQAAT